MSKNMYMNCIYASRTASLATVTSDIWSWRFSAIQHWWKCWLLAIYLWYKWIEFIRRYTIHACIHIVHRRNDAAYPIPVSDRGRSTSYCLLQTLSPKGSRWVQLHTVSRWRWPGRSSAWGLSQPCRQSGEKEWRTNIIIVLLHGEQSWENGDAEEQRGNEIPLPTWQNQ